MKRFAVALAGLVCVFTAAHVGAQAPLFVPAASSPVPVGPGSSRVIFADVNRDGRLDMLTPHPLRQLLPLHLGDGKGQFTPGANSPMRFDYGLGAVIAGDVNHDGRVDL